MNKQEIFDTVINVLSGDPQFDYVLDAVDNSSGNPTASLVGEIQEIFLGVYLDGMEQGRPDYNLMYHALELLDKSINWFDVADQFIAEHAEYRGADYE